ncbi:MAG: galactose ABC transporter substrate-binding protein, partial [Lachnospiraceae bacterium]|nr:galactose ABC transporter substrate-binding protein [Lachnospiraceae bacterium]
MKLFKKVMAMGLASTMVLSMAACGGGSTETTAAETTVADTTAAETEETKAEADASEAAEETAAEVAEATGDFDASNVKVGISIYKFDDNFMTLYRTELERYLTEDLGFKAENITIQDGKGDQAE